jgi:hypothetical protein
MNKAKMNSVTKIAALDFEVRVGFRSAGALRCVIADTSNLLPQYAQKIAVDWFPLAQLGSSSDRLPFRSRWWPLPRIKKFSAMPALYCV